MNVRKTVFGTLTASVLLFSVGCQNSNSEPAALSTAKLSPDTVIRIFWDGKDNLGDMANAFYFMRVWGLPQSKQLEVQTLKKLSAVPLNLSLQSNRATDETRALLYPLWADVVWNQTYFESRQRPGQPAESILAVHLDPPRDSLWRTNLTEVVQSLAGVRPKSASDGWSFEQSDPIRHVRLLRVGQWTLLSVGPERNDLFSETVARIQRDQTPYVLQNAGDWLEGDFDSAQLFPGFAAFKIHLTMTGDGAHVLTHADLLFTNPLNLALPNWNVPTNLVHPPLVSFTAARGLESALASWKPWNDLGMGQPPGQVCLWARPFGMVQTYFAAPLPDARNQIHNLSAHLLTKSNPWLAQHGYLGFDPDPDTNGVTWGNSPAVKPFIKSVDTENAGGMAYGGLIPETDSDTQTNFFYDHPSFPDLLQQLSRETNLVYFNWELTGPRMQSSTYIGQLVSILSRCPPLPLDSVSAAWLRTIAPRLGNSTTSVALSAPNQLELTRSSTVGFTAAELNLLANWLESPQFPSGLYSTKTPPPTQ